MSPKSLAGGEFNAFSYMRLFRQYGKYQLSLSLIKRGFIFVRVFI
ncbi:hypothetical protein yinte0001_10260 [Yersinia intermedia ATCC 29909]|nr:hypothetical protein yinte0001_10260 [Yersinia intermedia ATCC 29909]